jgi:hypothetical protein
MLARPLRWSARMVREASLSRSKGQDAAHIPIVKIGNSVLTSADLRVESKTEVCDRQQSFIEP